MDTHDKVCPPPRSEAMVGVIRKRGGVADYICFDGEAHGFVRADSIIRSFEAEREFYERVL